MKLGFVFAKSVVSIPTAYSPASMPFAVHAAVAFSSGVDSTFLLKVAKEVLGDNVIAVTAVSSVIPQREIEEAEKSCEEHNIKHLPISIDVLSMDAFKTNPPDRCYHCKKRIFTEIINAASSMGITDILEGSNTDDDGDYYYVTSDEDIYFFYIVDYDEIWLFLKGDDLNLCLTCE